MDAENSTMEYIATPAGAAFLSIGLCGMLANAVTLTTMAREMSLRNPFLLALAIADELSCIGFVYTAGELLMSNPGTGHATEYEYDDYTDNSTAYPYDEPDGDMAPTVFIEVSEPTTLQYQYICGYKMIGHLCTLTASCVLTLLMGLDRLFLISSPDRYPSGWRRGMLCSSIFLAYCGVPGVLIYLLIDHRQIDHETMIPFCAAPLAIVGRPLFWIWIELLAGLQTAIFIVYLTLGFIARKGFRRVRRASNASMMRANTRTLRWVKRYFRPLESGLHFRRPKKQKKSWQSASSRSNKSDRRVSFDRFSIISKELRHRLMKAVLTIAVGSCLTWTLTLALLVIGASLSRPPNGELPSLNFHLLLYSWILPCVSSLINACIYFTGHREYRNAFQSLVAVALPRAGKTAISIGQGTERSSHSSIWQHRTYGRRWANHERHLWRNLTTIY